MISDWQGYEGQAQVLYSAVLEPAYSLLAEAGVTPIRSAQSIALLVAMRRELGNAPLVHENDTKSELLEAALNADEASVRDTVLRCYGAMCQLDPFYPTVSSADQVRAILDDVDAGLLVRLLRVFARHGFDWENCRPPAIVHAWYALLDSVEHSPFREPQWAHTNSDLAGLIVAFADPRMGETACDPHMGTGAILHALLRHLFQNSSVKLGAVHPATAETEYAEGIDGQAQDKDMLLLSGFALRTVTMENMTAQGGARVLAVRDYDLIVSSACDAPADAPERSHTRLAACPEIDSPWASHRVLAFALERLSERGRAVVLCPHAALSAPAGRQLNKYLVEHDMLDGVVDLSPEGVLLLFTRDKPRSRAGLVTFCRQALPLKHPGYGLPREAAYAQAVSAFRDEGLRSGENALVDLETIRHRGYDLGPSWYLNEYRATPEEARRTVRGFARISELVREGEGQNLEVKASLKLDVDGLLKHGGAKAYRAEQGLLKTVVGMLNAEGGTVVLGLIEEAQYDGCGSALYEELPPVRGYRLLGIEEDEKAYRGSKDHYERTVRDLVRDNVGPTVDIGVRFHDYCGRTVCEVVVSRAQGMWHQLKGMPFMVRQGNRTQPLSDAEADEYKRSRARGEAT